MESHSADDLITQLYGEDEKLIRQADALCARGPSGFRAACIFLRGAVRDRPKLYQARTRLGHLLNQAADYFSAVEDLKSAIDDPAAPSALLEELALALNGAGHYEEASKAALRALVKRPCEVSRTIMSSGFYRLKQCRHGYMLYNSNDLVIGRSLDQFGEFGESEIALFSQLVAPGMVVIDLGANIGTHTVYFANAVGPSGMVIAFEPQRILFQLLCANVALNSLMNVKCFWAAVGASMDSLLVPSPDYLKPGNFGGISVDGKQQGELVSLVTLDSLDLPTCDLIKIDVEGMERDVILGAVQTLSRCKPILHVENNRGREKSEALIATLRSVGYRLYWHYSPEFNPDNFFKVPEPPPISGADTNMLCVPEGFHIQLTGFEEIE